MLRQIPTPIDLDVPGGTTNTYLVGDPSVLVDPVGGLDTLGIDAGDFEHVAVTHTHADHTLGVPQIRAETSATIWAFAPYRSRFVAQTGIEPDQTFRPGAEIGSTGVSVVTLPGHAPDHVGFLCDRSLIVGDLARADGSVMIGETDGDMRAYFTSLRRCIHSDIESAHPGHGPAITDPQERFTALLAHRLKRELLVEAAVQEGARTPEEIVTAAYSKDLTGVEDAAGQTVRAHLAKLACEGRVTWDGTTAGCP